MTFARLYEAVQQQEGRISTKWLRDRAIAFSDIAKIKQQWTGLLDPERLRGFYVEGPFGPPVPLKENEALIVLARSMCNGPVGEHWRRLAYTKELMHVFDTADEKTNNRDTFDLQIERLRDPRTPTSPQYAAETKAVWRALAVLCPETRRLEFKTQIEKQVATDNVVAAAVGIPVRYVGLLMRAEFPDIIKKLGEIGG